MNQQQRAVIKQALEALEVGNNEWKSLADSGDSGYWKAEDQDHYKQANEAIAALRQLLEQPVQEPAGWLYTRNGHEHIFSWTRWGSGVRKGWGETPLSLYTTPPAQPAAWVGLTDEERERLILESIENVTVSEAAMFKTVARAIEAKLREKNGGE
jgi:hypothetical protein